MKKYLLDTSVYLHDPKCIFAFEDNEIIIPREVILELDKLRGLNNSAGRNARETILLLKDLFIRKTNINDIIEQKYVPVKNYTIEIPTGGKITLFLDIEFYYNSFCSEPYNVLSFNYELGKSINNGIKNVTDMRLIDIACKTESILVTKDYGLQLLALQTGVYVEDYLNDIVEEFYTGYQEIDLLSNQIDNFYQKEKIFLEEHKLIHNEFVTFKAYENPNKTALGRFKKTHFHLIKERKVYGLKPLNREQLFALNLLMDPAVEMVTITGAAGTGKTLLALAAGLEQVESGQYKKILIARPTTEDHDLGFLPGELDEKLRPWVQPVYDAIEVLFDQNPEHIVQEFKDRNKMEIQSLQHLRGRSVPKQFFFIDEAQNLTPKDTKLIISRAGKGTKVILAGDIDQIDHPYLSKYANGLTHVINNMKDQNNYGHIHLSKSDVRSRLAEQAANLL